MLVGASCWRTCIDLRVEEIEIKNVEHLGILAGLIDEIGIEAIINEAVGTDNRQKLTPGQVVKAIILKGLGFVSRPLYLFSQDGGIPILMRAGDGFFASLSQLVANIIYFAERPAECGV